MKKILLTAFTVCIVYNLYCQPASSDSTGQRVTDSLKKELAASQPDSNRVKILLALGAAETLIPVKNNYREQALQLAEKIGNKRLHSLCLRSVGNLNYGDQPAKALALFLKALDISESINDKTESGRNNRVIGGIYIGQKDYTKAKYHFFKARKLLEDVGDASSLSITLEKLGQIYYDLNLMDSALLFYQQAYDVGLKANENVAIISLMSMGRVYTRKGEYATAMKYLRQSYEWVKVAEKLWSSKHGFNAKIYLDLAEVFKKTGQSDSSLFYAKQSFAFYVKANYADGISDAGKFLFNYYDNKNDAEAYKYLKIITRISDSLNPVQRAKEIQNLAFEEEQRLQSIEVARVESRNQMRLYIILGGLLSILIIAFVLFRNNRHKQKANELLKKQKQEIDEQRAKAELSLKELKTTQAQLIQSEKMASLGELTAGIAHEIQNPLNFVNNFSEVNKELLVEMKDELDKGNLEDAKALANDIIDNEEKINHHGKRADAIVKGMLQHSRSSSGVKEPTDINALADEYLRLAYHGLRAKDKSFNAILKTDYDESIGNISIIPQDIGRVVLNLITNAFYVVTEKKKLNISKYEPTVSVSTKKINGKVEIKVADNGNGIPQKILDKIFQPFFTTKPTGQGTGLGLSLSYDIVKAHGGELKVETKEGEGSEFIIQLPVNS
jgi:two-component system, NtrC family, sensor kinase